MRTCSVEGCAVQSHAGGMCSRHYAHFTRHGTPHGPSTPPAERGAILTHEQVFEIRSLRAAGVSPATLAAQFGVTRHTIWNVASGRTWRGLSK
jgi:hypothetical protein